ncbi:MAG: ZIP family metal transporter [Bacteroidales bacterium]|nr:ZIP family metal transporter [Bacteroidales bacterium]
MNYTLTIILGFSIIFIMTTLGSSLVFFFRNDITQKVNSFLLGLAGGIMVAASIWSLIMPSIEMSEVTFGKLAWLPAALSIILGGLALALLDKVVPHMHNGTHQEEGPKSHFSKSMKLFFAVTLHNIPEGLAVGFAFGAAAVAGESAAYISALGLAIGIGIQNFPEGAAISLPMKQVTGSSKKAFLFGMGSGVVEPLSAIIGFLLASHLIVLQPWLLAFSAGAMLFVVAEDLIPDANISENPHNGTWGFMFGFIIMMILDVALG